MCCSFYRSQNYYRVGLQAGLQLICYALTEIPFVSFVMPFGITRHLSNTTTHLINSCQHSLITIFLLSSYNIDFPCLQFNNSERTPKPIYFTTEKMFTIQRLDFKYCLIIYSSLTQHYSFYQYFYYLLFLSMFLLFAVKNNDYF